MSIFNEDFIKKFNNEKDNKGILNEASIYKNNNDKYSITIDLGVGREMAFLLNPYMKLYNSSDFKKATKIARIDLITGRSIIHEGLPLLKINSSIIKWLIAVLTTKESSNKKYSGMLVYDAIWQYIYDTSKQYGFNCAIKPDINDFIENLRRNN